MMRRARDRGEAGRLRRAFSFANVISLIALFVALGGGAYALSKNSVGSKQIKKNAVKAPEIAKGAVLSGEVKNATLLGSDLAANTVGGAQIADGGVTGTEVNEGTLVGLQDTIQWARFASSDNTLPEQSGGITVEFADDAGTYILDFGSSQAGKAVIATTQWDNDDVDVVTAAALCGGAPNALCTGLDADATDARYVFVRTTDTTGGDEGTAEADFYVATIG